MSQINPKQTKAILIGVSEFQDKSFINALPIKNNVTKLYDLLQDTKIAGIPKENILMLNNNERHDDILMKIEQFIENDFIDTVIFYFAGHGYKNNLDNKFYLVTNNANKKRINMTAIPWDEIKNILEKGSGIQQRFYILDACHSGSAALGENDEELTLEDGSALIAAAKADSKAYFNQTDQYTYFSGALINILEKGIDEIDLEAFSINPLYYNLQKKLKEKHFDITKKTTDKIENVDFFKNINYNPQELKRRRIKQQIAKADKLFAELHFSKAELIYNRTKRKIQNEKITFENDVLQKLDNKISDCEQIVKYEKVFDSRYKNKYRTDIEQKKQQIEKLQKLIEEKIKIINEQKAIIEINKETEKKLNIQIDKLKKKNEKIKINKQPHDKESFKINKSFYFLNIYGQANKKIILLFLGSSFIFIFFPISQKYYLLAIIKLILFFISFISYISFLVILIVKKYSKEHIIKWLLLGIIVLIIVYIGSIIMAGIGLIG